MFDDVSDRNTELRKELLQYFSRIIIRNTICHLGTQKFCIDHMLFIVRVNFKLGSTTLRESLEAQMVIFLTYLADKINNFFSCFKLRKSLLNMLIEI